MKKAVFTFLLLSLSLFTFSQTNYYVSTAGSNANSGTLASPWLTIQYGIYQLAAGDTLNVLAGTYSEKVDFDVSGTALAYVTLRNYQSDVVTLDAGFSIDNLPILYTDDSYQRIIGLHLTNNQINYATGLSLQDRAHHIEIVNNRISRINFSSNINAPVNTNTNSVPLGVLGDHATDSIHDIIIRGNEIFDNRTGYSENLTFGGNVSGFLVENNTVHDNANIGIDATGNYGECPTAAYDRARDGIIRNNLVYNCNSTYSTSAGIYVDGGKDIVVENNTCHHNGYGGEIGCEEDGEVADVIFRNNLFYQNFYAGMHIGGYDVNTTGKAVRCVVSNNTFYQNDTGSNFNGELIFTESEDCEIINNIFYISSQNVFTYSDRTQTNLTLDYNLVYAAAGAANIEATIVATGYVGLANYYTATGYGSNSTFGDPLFLSAPSDLHIGAASVAIDAGDPSFIPAAGEVDMDNEGRASGAFVDCGADEIQSSLVVEYLQTLSAKVKADRIQLSWSTISEQGSDYFEIERTTPSQTWEILGQIKACGQSIIPNSYVFFDKNPPVGLSHYRLRQVDKDGSNYYSNTVSVSFQKQAFSLFPNPSKGLVNVTYEGDINDEISYQILDLQGRLVDTGILSSSSIDMRKLAAGTYLIKIKDAKGQLLGSFKELILGD